MDDEEGGGSAANAASLRRREFIGLTAAGISVIATGCADDVQGGDSEGSSESSGDTSGSPSEAGTSAGPNPATTADASTGTGEETGTDTDDPPPGDFDPESIPESVEIFPRTVMAGDMLPDHILVACFVSDAQAVVLRVWLPGEPGQVDIVHEEEVTPDANGFVKVPVDGLDAGTWYSYALFRDVGGAPVSRSLIGEVRTALGPDDLEPITVAIGACVGPGGIIPDYVDPDDPQPMSWPSITQAGQQDLDAFLHLGDQGYLDNVWDAGGAYELYLSSWGALHAGGYRELYPKCGIYTTWDDHEVTNNGTVDPWTTDPAQRERIANAIRAYYTVMPIDATEPFTDPLWRSFAWGQTVEFIVLDCRYERDQPQDRYVSDEQLAFLLERLQNSPCHFKCILNSVPFANLGAFLGADDRWQGYATQRDAIKAFVNDNDIDNVLWVTGDIHLCYVGQVEENEDTAAGRMWEVCVTSGNTNPLAFTLSANQFQFRSADPHVPVIHFDPDANEVIVTFYTPAGDVAHEEVLTLS